MKDELLTNEWYNADKHKPWKDREVLVEMSDGTRRTLLWNGMYWCEPLTLIRQRFTPDGLQPAYFYIYERRRIS